MHMNKDRVIVGALITIVALLAAIAARLWMTPMPVTRADFINARKIENDEERKAVFVQLRQRVPVVHVDGGSIEVSGSVSID